jgi:glucokinase
LKALVIDLGGSHATLAMVEDRLILGSEELALDRTQGLNAALPLFVETFGKLLARLGGSMRSCDGLVLGFCGLADVRTGRVLSTNKKYDDAPSLDLPQWCRREFGIPFRLENDARMALLGEVYAGAAVGVEDVVMMTLGTGIGGAAMMAGQLVRGKHAQAGCLGGHLPIRIGGRICTCGAEGCAEAEASGWALPLIAEEWPGFADSALASQPQMDFRTVFEIAESGDAVARGIRDWCLRVWSATVVGLIHAYDPETVVMGGGVMLRAASILPAIQEYVHQHAWTPWGKVKVVSASLGNHAALLGAVPLLSERI